MSAQVLPPTNRSRVSLDVGYLALFCGYAFGDAVQAEIQARFGEVRFSWGFVFQHLVEGERTVGELAKRMGITQQAVSKRIQELLREGMVMTSTKEGDARVTWVSLSPKGWELVEASRAARKKLVRKLEKRLGSGRLAEIQEHLTELLDALGGAEAVRQRRVEEPR